MSKCIFCKIVAGEIPSNKILETENHLAFTPIKPAAPVHVLCIPKRHIEKNDAISVKEPVWDELFRFANEVIKNFSLDKTGYRIVNNGAGFHGVDHEHIHVLGGGSWRPKDDL